MGKLFYLLLILSYNCLENGIVTYTCVFFLHGIFSKKTKKTSDMKMQQYRMSEVPLKHFQRHFHKYILQMYITPQSSLKPTDGITESYCRWCYHSDKSTLLFLFFFYNWLHTVSLDIYSTSFVLSLFYPETRQT